MLQTNSLCFSYHEHTRFQFPDLSLNTGEHLLVLGKSGIGKTTLLHLLAGLLQPKSGSILIHETDISQLQAQKLDQFRGKNIGLVFQKPHFIRSLTLLENLLLIQKTGQGRSDKKDCLAQLERVELAGNAHQKTFTLSQGEQQRAGIVLATINQPKLILADEPTASLDDENTQKAMELLHQLANEGQANLVTITHDHRVKPYFENVLALTNTKQA